MAMVLRCWVTMARGVEGAKARICAMQMAAMSAMRRFLNMVMMVYGMIGYIVVVRKTSTALTHLDGQTLLLSITPYF